MFISDPRYPPSEPIRIKDFRTFAICKSITNNINISFVTYDKQNKESFHQTIEEVKKFCKTN